LETGRRPGKEGATAWCTGKLKRRERPDGEEVGEKLLRDDEQRILSPRFIIKPQLRDKGIFL
jgi:hypothetical protein